MEEKLRTLKDLDFNAYLEYGKGYNNREEFIRQLLRQEAIKWIKYNNTLQGEGDVTDGELDYCNEFIIKFFNITEEELK